MNKKPFLLISQSQDANDYPVPTRCYVMSSVKNETLIREIDIDIFKFNDKTPALTTGPTRTIGSDRIGLFATWFTLVMQSMRWTKGMARGGMAAAADLLWVVPLFWSPT